jgi:hypothetical protein
MKIISAQIAVLLVAVALGSAASSLKAADADPSLQKKFDNLINAIKAKDRDAFLASSTDAVNKGTTQQVMDRLHGLIGARLAKGFESTYLCRLKQQGHEVHLWKVSFKDEGDDVVIRIVLKDGKLAGFFLQ